MESESDIGEAEQDNVETSKGPSTRMQKNHPQDLIIGDLDQMRLSLIPALCPSLNLKM